MLHQVAHFLLHQAFGEFHLELLHQGCNQGVMAVALLAALGVVFEALLQVGAQFGHCFFIAGLLGEGVVEFRQLAGFEVLKVDHKAGFAAAGVLFGVVLGELALNGFLLTDSHSHDPFHEAGDHAAVFQLNVHGIGAAPFDGAAVIAVGAGEAHHSHIAIGSGTVFHWHQCGHLATGLFDHLVDLGGVVADALRFGFQAFGGFELGNRGDVGFQGDGQFLAGIERFEQGLEAVGEVGLAQGLDLFLVDGFTPHAIHH